MVVEAPVEDQAIVVKSYRPVQLTWSQLPQVEEESAGAPALHTSTTDTILLHFNHL